MAALGILIFLIYAIVEYRQMNSPAFRKDRDEFLKGYYQRREAENKLFEKFGKK